MKKTLFESYLTNLIELFVVRNVFSVHYSLLINYTNLNGSKANFMEKIILTVNKNLNSCCTFF